MHCRAGSKRRPRPAPGRSSSCSAKWHTTDSSSGSTSSTTVGSSRARPHCWLVILACGRAWSRRLPRRNPADGRGRPAPRSGARPWRLVSFRRRHRIADRRRLGQTLGDDVDRYDSVGAFPGRPRGCGSADDRPAGRRSAARAWRDSRGRAARISRLSAGRSHRDKVAAMYERHGAGLVPSTRYRDLVDLVAIVRSCAVPADAQRVRSRIGVRTPSPHVAERVRGARSSGVDSRLRGRGPTIAADLRAISGRRHRDRRTVRRSTARQLCSG